MSQVYRSLSHEGRTLLDETMEQLDVMYDDNACLLAENRGVAKRHNVRASTHYALGLLIRGSRVDIQRAACVLNAVIDTQYDSPNEIYHGTFRRATQEPHPPQGAFPWREISLYERYFMDVAWERITNALHKRLVADKALKPYAAQVEEHLSQSVLTNYPVVWKSYDPNWREFILNAFALILEHFEDLLPSSTVQRMLDSASKAIKGAIARSQTGFTPLNTNIEIMHVFIADYFGHRLRDQAAVQHAIDCAEALCRKYEEFHSVNEYNSPTYYGIDLIALGCWRKFARHARIRKLGEKLEAALWEDIADTYNHAMRNMCGPFSRNYEMDMSKHTSLHALLFIGLGIERFSERPLNVESDHNLLLVLCGAQIPEIVQNRLLATGEERTIEKRFRELNERGDPKDNASLCTTTAWITDTLMIGGMSGSKNVSGQLHSATVHWRDALGGVSSMRLLRSGEDGRIEGFHTVLFDCWVDRNCMSIDVYCEVNRDIKVFFEFESSDIQQAVISRSLWEISGLRIRVDAQAPDPFVEKTDTCLRICFLARDDQPETKKMHFDMECVLVSDMMGKMADIGGA